MFQYFFVLVTGRCFPSVFLYVSFRIAKGLSEAKRWPFGKRLTVSALATP